MPVFLPGQTDIYALTDARLSCGLAHISDHPKHRWLIRFIKI